MFNPQPGTIHRQGTLSHFAGYDFDYTVTRDEANKIMSESVSDTRDFEISSSSTFFASVFWRSSVLRTTFMGDTMATSVGSFRRCLCWEQHMCACRFKKAFSIEVVTIKIFRYC